MRSRTAVMIVEDEALLAMSLDIALQGMGYRVTGMALSGAEAEAFVSKDRPDVILMDLTLGDEDGAALAQRLIKSHGIPVVFLTGYSDPMTLRRLESIQHSGVLVKPVDDDVLDDAIKKAARKDSSP